MNQIFTVQPALAINEIEFAEHQIHDAACPVSQLQTAHL